MNIDGMRGLPGMDRELVLTFSNGWKPGEFDRKTVVNVAAAIEILNDGGWCWPPDESSDAALKLDLDVLADHLRNGDPAFLISPLSADLVHLQSIA